MPIQILPARLANQIAAGEVVERPASVVKELVENSLDAGATRIDIDIDKGGSRTIRIRDNGKGIPKEELSLALSRHATSKITSLDDLEAIMSLGFRGEALASISSVSRLTLTSKTADQEEAWSAYAEGRDMEVQLKPAAHPVGTTLEVLDLFFNTPARRKFLRTEKTEFSHIDELLKRIALSRLDVTINLRHNGKMIRQYRASQTQVQKERRLAAVCGSNFLNHALAVELEHGDLKLSGWICSPQGARAQNDIQYCYVNGRMMKDKLINHAIRQAYETSLAADQYAAYVLFIEVDPHQVDVNVHPAKHEVRFHQARLVHDFICQGLQSALQQGLEHSLEESSEALYQPPRRGSAEASQAVAPPDDGIAEPSAVMSAVARTPDYPNKAHASEWLPTSNHHEHGGSYREAGASRASGTTGASGMPRGQGQQRQFGHDAPSKREVSAYQQLMQTPKQADFEPLSPAPIPVPTASSLREPSAPRPEPTPRALETRSSPSPVRQTAIDAQNGIGLGKALCLTQQRYLLLSRDNGVFVLSLDNAQRLRCKGQLQLAQTEGLKPQPLLIPHSVPVEPGMIECAEQHAQLLKQLGIHLKAKGKNGLIIMSVCMPLRQQNLQQLIPALLGYLASVADDPEAQGWDKLLDWLASQLVIPTEGFSLSQAIQLVTDLEQLWGDSLEHYYPNLLRPVDVGAAIEAFDL
ncbi:DNA mismatch repair protein MutL [Photobacterium proteolyticum]|uniref:DNA mismatch repair protein MutL n=1 Tax=Photobacterium proteolyticum TaxID=1903952 RepID=A0A1Q9G7I8_9GAMM|nr:DNA mismatch repair endonuclease MutL [Photobacterium proteolyticum]OLQ70280.1 DNA mismatch repair protein MutL [Photobacterium proteolyticum]